MTLTRRTTVEAEGVDLLIYRFRKTRIVAWLRSYLSEVQLAEDALWQLYVERRLPSAVGAQLDIIGRVVGEPRLDRDDAAYRPWIGARILANRSRGRAEELITIVRAVTPSTTLVHVREEYPAALTVRAYGAIPPATGDALAQLLAKAAKAAGVRILFQWTTMGDSIAFRFAPNGWTGAETFSAQSGFGRGMFAVVSDGRPMRWNAPELVTRDGEPVTSGGVPVWRT